MLLGAEATAEHIDDQYHKHQCPEQGFQCMEYGADQGPERSDEAEDTHQPDCLHNPGQPQDPQGS